MSRQHQNNKSLLNSNQYQVNILKQSTNNCKINAHQSTLNFKQTPLKNHKKNQSQISIQSNKIDSPADNKNQILKQQLDNQFVIILKSIQILYVKLTKHQQIRVQKWIVKMVQNDQTVRWKQNRNNYLKLLNFYIQTGHGLNYAPFNVMPEKQRGLQYLSDHQLTQKIKTKIQNKPVFSIFPHKPQLIKIDQPLGDDWSVLMSIIQTARSTNNEIKNKKSIQQPCLQSQISKRKQSNLIQQEQKPVSSRFFIKQTSSVIHSNLPSQVKRNNSSNTNRFAKYQNQNLQNSNPQSNLGSKLSYSLLTPNKRIDIQNNHRPQLQRYKQIIYLMGKVLLKHQFTLQKQKQYWSLMRMISDYYCNQGQDFQTFLHKIHTDINSQCQNTERYQRLSKFNKNDKIKEQKIQYSKFTDQNHHKMNENKYDQSKRQKRERQKREINQNFPQYQDQEQSQQYQFYQNEEQIQEEHQFIRPQNDPTSQHQRYNQNNQIFFDYSSEPKRNNPKKLIRFATEQQKNYLQEQSMDFQVQQGQSNTLFFQLKQRTINTHNPCDQQSFRNFQHSNAQLSFSPSTR